MANEAEEDIEFDEAPPVVAAPTTQALAAPPAEVKTQDFSPTLTVIGKKKERIDVAVNAASNRAQGQLMTSKLRTLLNRKLDELLESGEAPDVVTIQKLTVAAEAVQSLSVMSYEGKKPLGQAMGSELERLAMGVVQSATKGAMQGMTDGMQFRDKVNKMKALGRKNAEIIVEAEPTK